MLLIIHRQYNVDDILVAEYIIGRVMKVKELMTKKVVTVTPDDMVDKVFVLFHFEAIRHLPVVTEKGTLVGVISDRDIKKVLGARHKTHVQKDGTVLTVSARKVRTMMRRQPFTIGPNEKAADAAISLGSYGNEFFQNCSPWKKKGTYKGGINVYMFKM